MLNDYFPTFQIYEGTTEEDPKVGRWCGSTLPPKYESQSNVLLIVFKSDWSAQQEGFRISYDTSTFAFYLVHNVTKCYSALLFLQFAEEHIHLKLEYYYLHCIRIIMKLAEHVVT